jgi:hypothetical protein
LFATAIFSQRIANQEFLIEIVDASGLHSASWLFDGTSVIAAKVLASNSGNSTGATTLTTNTSTNYLIYEVEAGMDEVNYYTRVSDVNSTRLSSAPRARQIPDPSLEYFVQIRARNLATAPASSTTFTFDSVSVQDLEQLSAEVVGGRGGGNTNQAIPVTGSVGITGTIAVTETQTPLIETGIALPINGVFVGTGRDSLNTRNAVRGWVFTDQSGTLIIEQSTNNSTWRQTHSFPVTGNATQVTPFEFKFLARHYRVRYINGAVAQTVLEVVCTIFNIGA